MDIKPVLQERGVLNVLMQVYDDRNMRYKIGESMLLFRIEDVPLILDLRYDRDIVSF